MTLQDRAVCAVARPIRRTVTLLAALAALGLVVLALRYGGTEVTGGFDERSDAWIQAQLAPHRAMLGQVVRLASPGTVVVMSGLVGLASLALGRSRIALVAIAGPVVTGLVTTALKPAIGRTLGGELALPSGHTGGATALAVVAALLAVSLARSKVTAVGLIASAGVLAVGAVMGSALVAIRVHYTTDTLAGFCTAMSVVLGIALVVDRLADRLRSG